MGIEIKSLRKQLEGAYKKHAATKTENMRALEDKMHWMHRTIKRKTTRDNKMLEYLLSELDKQEMFLKIQAIYPDQDEIDKTNFLKLHGVLVEDNVNVQDNVDVQDKEEEEKKTPSLKTLKKTLRKMKRTDQKGQMYDITIVKYLAFELEEQLKLLKDVVDKQTV